MIRGNGGTGRSGLENLWASRDCWLGSRVGRFAENILEESQNPYPNLFDQVTKRPNIRRSWNICSRASMSAFVTNFHETAKTDYQSVFTNVHRGCERGQRLVDSEALQKIADLTRTGVCLGLRKSFPHHLVG